MRFKTVLPWALAGALVSQPASAIQFADTVLSYDPGVGYATDFETGLGYTLTETVLGAPNRDTDFGAVQPFNPPFARGELLSLGVGGQVVLQFAAPILNAPEHLFGLDFIVYGSAGFIDIAYPDGHTDETASLFGQNSGQTVVSVSADNETYYVLDPAFAPTVDTLFPTDGAGSFGVPVDPSLTQADLADKSLAEIRALYNGSAGGTGYDLGWALDENGQSVHLESAQYLRIDVLSGRAEIDAVAAVPEPAAWTFLLAGLGWFAVWFPWRRRSSENRG